jgi:flagellar operon protein
MADEILKSESVKNVAFNSGQVKVNRTGGGQLFSEILKSKLESESGIKFSAHAMDRLNDRGIKLESSEISRLSNAVAKAGEKGAVDSLILVDDKAFIVSIKNRTVVTAMTGENIKNNVFSNIDSAIIA